LYKKGRHDVIKCLFVKDILKKVKELVEAAVCIAGGSFF